MLTHDEARAARMARLTERAQAKAATLRDAAARAIEALRRHPSEACFQALGAIDGSTGVSYDEYGTTVDEAPCAEIFATPADLARALEARTYEATAIAVSLLLEIAPAAAFPLMLSALPVDEDLFPSNYLEHWITMGVRGARETFARRLGPDDAAQLFLAGQLPLAVLGGDLLERVSIDALAEAARADRLGYLDGDEVQRILASVPPLRAPEGKLALLRALGEELARPHGVWALAREIIPALGAARYAEAAEVLAAVRARNEGAEAGPASLIHSWATTALFALGHRATTERVAAELAPRAAALAPAWDPHHTVPALRDPIRAAFALDPATSSARLAPFFRAEAIATDAGAKVAHDILRLGLGEMTFHGATRLGTGESWLRQDRGWVEVLSGLRAHRRLGAVVRDALAELGETTKKRPATTRSTSKATAATTRSKNAANEKAKRRGS